MEIDIRAIAGDYNSIYEFREIWEKKKPNFYTLNKSERESYNAIENLLNGVQTKYISVELAENLEFYTGNTRSTKRTKQIKKALEKLKETFYKNGYEEIMKRFIEYEEYVNFDKQIVLTKSEKHEGCWEIKTLHLPLVQELSSCKTLDNSLTS